MIDNIKNILILYLISTVSVYKLCTQPDFRTTINFIFTTITLGVSVLLTYHIFLKSRASKRK